MRRGAFTITNTKLSDLIQLCYGNLEDDLKHYRSAVSKIVFIMKCRSICGACLLFHYQSRNNILNPNLTSKRSGR